MPVESVFIICGILSAFIIFAATLAYGMSRSAKPRPRARLTP
jgi:hypothetical protein